MNESSLDVLGDKLLNGLEKVVSGAGKVLSEVLTSSELMRELIPLLAVAIPPPWDVVAMVALKVIAVTMGVTDDPERLGYQMNLADRRPEDFSTFSDYKKYLNDNFPFDADRFLCMSDGERKICQYVGMAGVLAQLKESKGFTFTPEALGSLARMAFNFKWDADTIGKFAKGMAGEAQKLEAPLDVSLLAKDKSGEMERTRDSVIAAGLKEAKATQSVDEIKAELANATAEIEK